MAGDWFADSEGDSDLGGRARNDTESHEVVDYAFGPSDSESESNTEKLKELLRDDSSKDVTFVGTASAGTDHIDTQYLSKRGIQSANAAGCNAAAVADYVLDAIYQCQRLDR